MQNNTSYDVVLTEIFTYPYLYWNYSFRPHAPNRNRHRLTDHDACWETSIFTVPVEMMAGRVERRLYSSSQ